jgi:serine protease AprX
MITSFNCSIIDYKYIFCAEAHMKKIMLCMMLFIFASTSFSRGLIDADVLLSLREGGMQKSQPSFAPQFISVLIFLYSADDADNVLDFLKGLGGIEASRLEFMPIIAAVVPKNITILTRIAEHAAVAQISSNRAGSEELENSAQSILLTSSPTNPVLSNWWDHGYIGQKGVIGLIDSGVAAKHLGLLNKKIIVRKEVGSGYFDFPEGIRSAHGTGVACIYAGLSTPAFPRDLGIAYGARTIVAGLAGEGVGEAKDLFQTLGTLDWMLKRAEIKPTVINYSFGNGVHACSACPDWSGLAKTVDYVVNHEKILWIKSAGNLGYVEPSTGIPYSSTMTVPADNYNGITVANMNPTIQHDGIALQTSDRQYHMISARSSRGPTIGGRKKPDISAPGDDTWTCAPDPEQYHFNYTDAMHYLSGYRLMGGTSSAAPHVGAAVLLMQDAGIDNPMLEKALLLNSADAWTDSDEPGKNDGVVGYNGGHHAVMGSTWNRTYGWGYINLQKAFDERENLVLDKLSVQAPVKEYSATLPVGAKVTLVHERRVGYAPDTAEWRLSHLSLEIVDARTQQILMKDDSSIDTVHQVANCKRLQGDSKCSAKTKEKNVIIRVSLLSDRIDGSEEEPFALAASVPLK